MNVIGLFSAWCAVAAFLMGKSDNTAFVGFMMMIGSVLWGFIIGMKRRDMMYLLGGFVITMIFLVMMGQVDWLAKSTLMTQIAERITYGLAFASGAAWLYDLIRHHLPSSRISVS